MAAVTKFFPETALERLACGPIISIHNQIKLSFVEESLLIQSNAICYCNAGVTVNADIYQQKSFFFQFRLLNTKLINEQLLLKAHLPRLFITSYESNLKF